MPQHVRKDWLPQIDGRLIYLHTILVEPELIALHYENMAKLCRRAALSGALRRRLANADVTARAGVFLLEGLLLQKVARPICESIASAFANRDRRILLQLDGETLRLCTPDFELTLGALFNELNDVGLSFVETLSTGVYVFGPESQGSHWYTFLRSSAAACAGITYLDRTADTAALLRACGTTLMRVWNAIELRAFEVVGKKQTNPPEFPNHFGKFLVAEYCRRSGRPEPPTFTDEVPQTPLCRDAFLGWRPGTDRERVAVGSPINHCTSLSDVAALL